MDDDHDGDALAEEHDSIDAVLRECDIPSLALTTNGARASLRTITQQAGTNLDEDDYLKPQGVRRWMIGEELTEYGGSIFREETLDLDLRVHLKQTAERDALELVQVVGDVAVFVELIALAVAVLRVPGVFDHAEINEVIQVVVDGAAGDTCLPGEFTLAQVATALGNEYTQKFHPFMTSEKQIERRPVHVNLWRGHASDFRSRFLAVGIIYILVVSKLRYVFWYVG